MDHLKAIEGLLAFHHAEIERLETARKVVLEIERRAGDTKVVKKSTPLVAKGAGRDYRSEYARRTPKAATPKAKPNGAPPSVPSAPAIKERVLTLLRSDPDLSSGKIMEKLDMTASTQHKQRVYTALADMKKAGVIAHDEARRVYRLPA